MNKKQKKRLYRILIALVCLGISFIGLESVFVLLGYVIVGYDVLLKAWKGILKRQVFDENFLMAVATIGALCLGDFKEGFAVMLFYQVGELFQSYAVGKSRDNITELMDIRPDVAYILDENGKRVAIDPDEVQVGSEIVVSAGEKIPMDGIVVSGQASLNTSALTGESVPMHVKENDEVLSGCVNIDGLLHIKTTKEFCDSTVSKILDMVENASSKKSRSEQFITRFAKYYTPVVCYSALALFVLGSLFTGDWSEWLYRALTFLVISCPCALVISIPLSFFAGIGGASRAGVLVKGANYLEALADVDMVVFDKTGTLTQGVFEVQAIHHSPISEAQVLQYAALAETYSNHPIAQSLKKAAMQVDVTRLKDVKEISGQGVVATIDSSIVLVGNDRLMKEYHIAYKDCHHIGTIVHVAVDGNYMGHIVISDAIKATSKQAIASLKSHHVSKTVMLSGDKKAVADRVGQHLGLDQVYSELLPQDKVTYLERLLKEQKGKAKLAYVGDGINDAPVLMRADIGIAMGALGSDAAIEAADVVLMDDDPIKVSQAIWMAKKCMAIVKENIVFAIGIKVLCLLLGAVGIANMWLAIFADVGVMILAVLNAIRTLVIYKGKLNKGFFL